MYLYLPTAWLHNPARLEVCCNGYVRQSRLLETILINPVDIDSNNICSSQHNVQLNNLEHRIRVINTDAEGPLFPLDKLGHETCVSPEICPC